MKKVFALALGVMLFASFSTATFAAVDSGNYTIKATDIPYIPDDNDGGPYTDPEPTPDPGPDSTDSGESWDSGSNGGGYDGCGGGNDGGVLF